MKYREKGEGFVFQSVIDWLGLLLRPLHLHFNLYTFTSTIQSNQLTMTGIPKFQSPTLQFHSIPLKRHRFANPFWFFIIIAHRLRARTRNGDWSIRSYTHGWIQRFFLYAHLFILIKNIFLFLNFVFLFKNCFIFHVRNTFWWKWFKHFQ